MPPPLLVAFGIVWLLAVMNSGIPETTTSVPAKPLSKITRVEGKEIIFEELQCRVSLPKGWHLLASSSDQSSSNSQFVSAGRVAVFSHPKHQTIVRLSPFQLPQWPPPIEQDASEDSDNSPKLSTNLERFRHISISWLAFPESTKDRANRRFGKLTVGESNLVVTILEHDQHSREGAIAEFLNSIQSLK